MNWIFYEERRIKIKLGELIKLLIKFKGTYGEDIETVIGKEQYGEINKEKIGGVCALGSQVGKIKEILIFDRDSDL